MVVLAMLPPASLIKARNAVELYLPPWGAVVPDVPVVPEVLVVPELPVVPDVEFVAGCPARNAVQSPNRACWLAGPVIGAVIPAAEPEVSAAVTLDPEVDASLPDCDPFCVPFCVVEIEREAVVP